MQRQRRFATGVFVLTAVFLTTGVALAQQPDASPETTDNGVVVPPSLKSQVEASYPPAARAQGLEGNVGLELVVEEDGTVSDVKVTSSAGNGFDEAAILAARKFVFEPARQNGKAIRSTVQFTYEFHLPKAEPALPPAPPPASIAPPPPAAPIGEQTGPDQSTVVLAQRPISAASSMAVRDREFQLRPIGSVQDILRVTPGILVVQHAGGGKANQYFLRGFDADHGTDIALSIDGIPINMVSHGHGQGYADTNFIIPEIVERVEVTKGPYFAEQGDFATAGAVNLVTRNEFQHSSLGFGGGGSPGYGGPAYRGLLVASPKFESGTGTGTSTSSVKPMFVAEVGRSNGPFHNPEEFDRYKLFNKVTFNPSSTSTLSIGGSSYAGNWYGSGQLARREVAAGRLDRFSTHDPSEGGDSARHQLFATYRLRPTPKSEIQALTYLAQYRLNIYSNFTLNLNDPDNGDGIVQKDRRTFAGGKVSYRILNEGGGPVDHALRFDTSIGANMRTDAARVSLDRQRQRQLLGSVVDASINETTIGAFAKEEVSYAKWIRLVGGVRADFFSFAVDDRREVANVAAEGGGGGGGGGGGATSGVKGASQLSPKTALILSPVAEKNVSLDVFGNYGHGFHSNDARGVVRSRDAVTPITRAIGYEGGARARLFNRWDLAAAVWRLNLSNETVWIGDEGTTEVSDATRRYGVEFETRFEITPWLAADLDLTATKSAFVVNRGNGDAVALAPRNTWAGGLSARHPTNGLRGGFRFYGVGDRPATEDEFIVAEGFSLFDLHLGYQHGRRFDIALDIENLFNTNYKSAQFATTSRLRTEPPTNAPPPPGTCGNGSRVTTNAANGNFAGCEDNHFAPGYPFTARVMTTFYLD